MSAILISYVLLVNIETPCVLLSRASPPKTHPGKRKRSIVLRIPSSRSSAYDSAHDTCFIYSRLITVLPLPANETLSLLVSK